MRWKPVVLVLILTVAVPTAFAQQRPQCATHPSAAAGHPGAGRMAVQPSHAMTPEQQLHMMNQTMMADQMSFESADDVARCREPGGANGAFFRFNESPIRGEPISSPRQLDPIGSAADIAERDQKARPRIIVTKVSFDVGAEQRLGA